MIWVKTGVSQVGFYLYLFNLIIVRKDLIRFMLNILIFYVIGATRILRVIKNRKILIIFLISIEYATLSFYILIFLTLKERFFLFNIIFIVIAVIERALGISLLISLGRSFGTNYLLTYPYLNYVNFIKNNNHFISN